MTEISNIPSVKKVVRHLFPTYEVGSLPKLPARVKAIKGEQVTAEELQQLRDLAITYGTESQQAEEIIARLVREKRKPNSDERKELQNFNALLNIRIQEKSGIDLVYDGEARRSEMYRHVAQQILGFEDLPEMIRSRGPDSYKKSVCIAEPQLKPGAIDTLIREEFTFVNRHAQHQVKVPIDDPYMIAVMSDNRYYSRIAKQKHTDRQKIRYEAKRKFTLALAKNVIRPQVEAAIALGAHWIQLDIPAATLDVEHIPILVEGINAVVEDLQEDAVWFSLHFCYPRRNSLSKKSGYELLFPHVLKLDHRVKHFSLELANADTYEQDLAVFAEYKKQRAFGIGLGVIDITLERQEKGKYETPQQVRERILRAAQVLKDYSLIYVAPDCGMRQLTLERCIRLYEIMAEGAELARTG